MAHRIPFQQFYDMLSNKYSQQIDWYDLYQLNEKEINHITNVFVSTIKDFSQTMKTENKKTENKKKKNKKYDTTELPKWIIYKNYKYLILPDFDKMIPYEYSFDYALNYLRDLVKIQDFDKINYIIDNNILDVKNYCHYHHNRCNDSGLFGFIELYIQEYIYFSLLLKDNNYAIQIDEKSDFQYVSYPDEFELLDIYKHYFNLPHKKLNESVAKKLYYRIVRNYRANKNILTNIVEENIKKKSIDENFIKTHVKFCFQIIYSVYHIMKKLYSEEELDKKVYRTIKDAFTNYFRY